MARAFDVLVVGTGVAGLTVAAACARAGRRVAVADEREYGGTCALRGCEPKKTLVVAARAVDAARRLQGSGVRAARFEVDWGDLSRFRRSFTDPVPRGREESMRRLDVATLHGRARFVADDMMLVGEEEVHAERIVVATGAKPRPLDMTGRELVATSEDFLGLERLPRRIVFVGGGYVSFELAHVAARAGAAPVILHRGERPLKQFDGSLVSVLVEASRAAGIDVRVRREVVRVARAGDGALEVTARGPGGEERVEADLVVHGAGRVPAIDDLALERGNVARTARGVKVDARMRSVSNPRVLAAGDAADGGGPPLTPVASLEASAVVAELLGEDAGAVDYLGVASVVFTLPPLAAVGLTEEEARRAGLDVDVHEGDMSDWAEVAREAHPHARYKTLVERGSGRIVGAHLLAPGAAEMINLFALAIRADVPAEVLRGAPLAFPTHGYGARYMLGE